MTTVFQPGHGPTGPVKASTNLQVLEEGLEGEAQEHAAGRRILRPLHAVGDQLAGALADMHAVLRPCAWHGFRKYSDRHSHALPTWLPSHKYAYQ